ncbi:MAG: hypothetical protein JNL28_05735 [Planctomycetes bacterium]|nr:hypothetical protein [Planctomycetota bacterium]
MSLRVAATLAFLGLAACGSEVEYYSDGARRAEGRLARDRAAHGRVGGEREIGPWQWWFPNGERREAGTIEDGKRVGEWTQWYPNGQRRSRGQREFDASTQSSPRTGLWTYWHENGSILARGVYRLGLREGHWDYSREDGSLDAELTGEYHADRRLD